MIGFVLGFVVGFFVGIGFALFVTSNWQRNKNWRGKDSGYQK